MGVTPAGRTRYHVSTVDASRRFRAAAAETRWALRGEVARIVAGDSPMAAKPRPMTTTLWEFPSQQYGDERQGDKEYKGATPSWVIWNLLQRFTRPGDLVVDPMVGSGTTLDVARDLGREALGYDLQTTRPEILRCDARKLPLENGKADFVFIDPPYSTHIEYSGDPRCIGELDASGTAYYEAMDVVIGEIDRILRPDRFMGLYVCDSFQKGEPLCPIGFELFARLRPRFEPFDIVAVVRRNRTLLLSRYHSEAQAGGFYLRGFNYLFIMYKPARDGKRRKLDPPAERQYRKP
jgi:DNA modification methylase